MNRTNLWVHFAHHHTRHTIMMLEEGNRSYRRCLKCDIFVSHKALSSRHFTMDFWQREEERKQHLLVDWEARAWTELAIIDYGIHLAPVNSLKYIGRVLSEGGKTGHRWSTTFREHGRNGRGWLGCWSGRLWMPGPWFIFTWRWFSRSCFKGWRCGSWHTALGGFEADFTTGWPTGWRGGNLGEDRTEYGYNPRWIMQLRRQDCRS